MAHAWMAQKIAKHGYKLSQKRHENNSGQNVSRKALTVLLLIFSGQVGE